MLGRHGLLHEITQRVGKGAAWPASKIAPYFLRSALLLTIAQSIYLWQHLSSFQQHPDTASLSSWGWSVIEGLIGKLPTVHSQLTSHIANTAAGRPDRAGSLLSWKAGLQCSLLAAIVYSPSVILYS